MRETPIVNKILKKLNSITGCTAEKVHGNAFQSGRPDINGCFYGYSFRMEAKSADTGYKATKIQLEDLARWERCGAVTGVVKSVDDALNLLDKIALKLPENLKTIYLKERG